MGAEAIIATAAVIGAVTGIGNTVNSIRSSEMQRKKQKGQAEDQQRAIAEQEAAALDERKQKINQLRNQMGGTGAGTRGYSSSGIKANISGSSATGTNTLG